MKPTMRTLLALAVLPTLAFAQRPVLEISGANFRPMPLAVAAPVGADDAEFDQALSFDLAASGLFQVLDRKSFLAAPNEGVTAQAIAFNRWTDVGAEALVKTALKVEGGNLKAELHLFSVAAGKEEFTVTESAAVKDARRLAHKLANAVYKFYTRETGPFETRIAFSRNSAGGRDIYVADWDGKNAMRVTNGDINVLPALIPGGGVAFTSYKNKYPFLYTSRGGGDPVKLLGDKGSMVSGVAYSPDGRRLAVTISENNGERAEIYVANADGSGLTKITDTRYFTNTSPSWSPDGKQLAFVSNRDGSPQIYVMNADGSAPKRLTFAGKYNTTPSWSPRGDLIAFTARDERNAFDIFTVNLENKKVTRLTQDAAGNEEPVFSPNGRLILFTSTRGGGRGLYVMTADGNNQIALPADKGDIKTPDWAN